jgi:phospholipid/cholesterol/gamma-HCH transport system substrate-binding protein
MLMKRLERMVRLAAAAGTAVAMTASLTACAPFGGGTMTVYAYMSDTAGVFVGNDVGVLGVPIGHITAIDPEGTRVKVTMEVDKDQPIPASAGAVVVPRSVATDRYIELTPVFHDGDAKMADGATIQEGKTRTPVEFDEVLQSISDFSVGIGGSAESREAIKEFVNTGAGVLGGKGPLLNTTITSLSDAVNGVYGSRGDITATLVSLDKLTKTIAQNQGTVREFIRQVTAATNLLAAERTNFRDSLRSISTAVGTMSDFVHTNNDQILHSVQNTTQLMKVLLVKRQQLVEILKVMPLGLSNLRKALTNGQIRVRVNPLVLLPLGSQLDTVCNQISKDLCTAVGGSNPAGVTSLLFGLLGGGR